MCTLEVDSCDPIRMETMRESATSAAAISYDDTIFWEELVEQDRQIAMVTVKLQAGDYDDVKVFMWPYQPCQFL